MSGAGLRERTCGKALSDILTLKPYWGKPAVRNFRGGDGNVGIIRSPLRAIAPLDHTGGRYDAGMRVLIVPLIISLGLAAGQTITPAERQAILAYQLNMPRANSLITTGVALSKYRASIPDFQANPASTSR